MEEKKNRRPSSSLAVLVMVVILVMSSSRVSGCPSDGSGRQCRGCIADRMKYGCPSCTPIIRCMARCLWAGNSESRCTQRCNCDNKDMKKKLASCKKCMLKCKCSCASA